MTNLISAQDLTDYAPDLDLTAFSATTVSGIIARATRMITNYCQVSGFDFTATTAETDAANIASNGDLYISVMRRPIFSVSAIRLVKGQFSTTLTITSNGVNLYQLNNTGNVLIYPNNYLAGTGTLALAGSAQLLTMKGANMLYEIDYIGGYRTIPDEVKEATTLLVRDIVNVRNNPQGAQGFSQGSYSVTYGTKAQSPLEERAFAILDQGDYVRRVL